MDWKIYFLEMTELIAKKSKDPSTKCGAVIVGQDNTIKGCGYNGFPRGIEYSNEKLQRPAKYKLICHAELNAILNCGRNGVPLLGTTIYINAPPCSDCAKAIIQSGIEKVITKKQHVFSNREDWQESFNLAQQMLDEAGVTYEAIS